MCSGRSTALSHLPVASHVASLGELLTFEECLLWMILDGFCGSSSCLTSLYHSHLHFEEIHCSFPEMLHDCRHTKQTSTSSAAASPDRGQPRKSASDYRDQDTGQAPSAIAPASLPVSETLTEAIVEAPVQISKEDRIAAAREKYLARKRQKTG